jgi:hypothetical protein
MNGIKNSFIAVLREIKNEVYFIFISMAFSFLTTDISP